MSLNDTHKIVVVDEEVLGYVVEGEFPTFYPLTFRIKGALVYAAGSPVVLGERHEVRPARLADSDRFRICLEGYGITE